MFVDIDSALSIEGQFPKKWTSIALFNIRLSISTRKIIFILSHSKAKQFNNALLQFETSGITGEGASV